MRGTASIRFWFDHLAPMQKVFPIIFEFEQFKNAY